MPREVISFRVAPEVKRQFFAKLALRGQKAQDVLQNFVENFIEEEIMFNNLDELYEAMKSHDPQTLDKFNQWRSDLPTFRGEEPADTTEIWSWDENRLIVGTCADDLEIKERPDNTKTQYCIYCGATVPIINQDPAHINEPCEIIPDVDADEEWDKLAQYHAANCEWILTRAHKKEDKNAYNI